jgi:hypothetical protein
MNELVMTLEDKKSLVEKLELEIKQEEELIELNRKKDLASRTKLSYDDKITLDFEIFSVAFFRSLSRAKKRIVSTGIFSYYYDEREFFRMGKHLFKIGNVCKVYSIKSFIESRPYLGSVEANENFYKKFESIIQKHL